MSEQDKQRMAAILSKAKVVMSEPGLEMPTEMRALQALNQVASGYGLGHMGGVLAQAMAAKGFPALSALGENGAIFPEGIPIPKDRALAKELFDVLPETQKAYRTNEALSNWHASNYDFPAVLKDKWAMLKHFTGS